MLPHISDLDAEIAPPMLGNAITPDSTPVRAGRPSQTLEEMQEELQALRAQIRLVQAESHRKDSIIERQAAQNERQARQLEQHDKIVAAAYSEMRYLRHSALAKGADTSRYDSGLKYINEGHFGKVYSYDRIFVAFKVVPEHDMAAALQAEFDRYSSIYPSVGTSQLPGGFWIPRALQFYAPATADSPMALIDAEPSPPRYPDSPRPRDSRKTGTELNWADFTTPVFAMDLIQDLGGAIQKVYTDLFWTPATQGAKLNIRMLRLYFGRTDIPPQTSELGPGVRTDPPLNIQRYQLLAERLHRSNGIYPPSVPEVSYGMGELLAKLHWLVGIDARDIELVLAGADLHAVQCWAFDFNQCQSWLDPTFLSPTATGRDAHIRTVGSYANNNLRESAGRLATMIGIQEYYYPRPSQVEPYTRFRQGYLDTVIRALEEVRLRMAKSANAEQAAAWTVITEEVVGAAEFFFGKFEEIEAERRARRERQASRGIGRVSKEMERITLS